MPASYRDIGPTQLLTATPDQTTRNPGNWTIEATQAALNCYVSLAEIYHIAIDGPVQSSVAIYRGTRLWENVSQGWSNSWDPTNPMIVRPTDEVFFFWKAAAGVWFPVPTATLWLRYNTELPENVQWR